MSTQTRTPLKVVIIEDNADDAALMVAQLRQSNFEPTWERVESAAEFLSCLDTPIDLILADYSLPDFDGLTALRMVQEHGLDIPFMLVSGTVGEELAVQAILAGANDYFLKDRLVRLGPAVTRVQAEAALRREQKQAAFALRYERDLLERLMNNLPDLIFFKDINSRFTRINHASAKSFGFNHPDDAIGLSDLDFQPPDIAAAFMADDQRVMNLRTPISDRVERIAATDGSIRWLSTTKAPTFHDDGTISGVVGIGRDITDRKLADEAQERSETKYRRLFEEAPVMYVLTENVGGLPFISDCNELFLQTLGYARDETIGQKLKQFITRDSWEAVQTTFRHTLSGGESEFERQLITRDGRIVDVLVQTRPEKDSAGEIVGTRSTLVDMTERKSLERRLVHQATHDDLTDLPNRGFFTERLRIELRSRPESPANLSIILIDLDNFKTVNDSLGHAMGDQLLIEVSKRLKKALVPGCLIARFGGDEFTILVPGGEGAHFEARLIATSLLDALRVPLHIGEREFRMSASIGIVESGDQLSVAEDMLQAADIALYRAKSAGRSQYRVYEHQMSRDVLARLDLESELARAVELGELRLHYQPEIDLITGRIVGAEALLRWNHPTRGLLAPAAFIEIAEESHLIVSLGSWVLKEACRQLDEWRDRFEIAKELHLSVNVSARQLQQPDFVDLVAQFQRQSGLPAGQIKLEITERVVVEDAGAEFSVLQALRRSHVKLAIDDFGTGYSSLGYLHRWPADIIKIDRSFVAGVHENEGSQKLVQAILGLGRLFDMGVTAEGIESEAELNWLREIGVERGQGYYFSRPLPAHEFELLLLEKNVKSYVMPGPERKRSLGPSSTMDDSRQGALTSGQRAHLV